MNTTTSPPARSRFRLRGSAVSWLLMAPGLLWLLIFFVIPMSQIFIFSVSRGSFGSGFEGPPTVWVGDNYATALTSFERNAKNSLVFGGLATLGCLLVGYPLAYAISLAGKRLQAILVILVIAPFFTSFVIRVISWKVLLADRGPITTVLVDKLGILSDGQSILGTPTAVVAGITYMLMPFAVLPLYATLQRIPRPLVEAAGDLYAGYLGWRGALGGALVGALVGYLFAVGLRWADAFGADGTGRTLSLTVLAGALIGAMVGGLLISAAFVNVILPLSGSGIFAASLLTFIPATGDYINASVLGGPDSQMLGNVIAGRFLEQGDYATAAALSFVFLAAVCVAIAVLVRVVGTDRLMEAVEK